MSPDTTFNYSWNIRNGYTDDNTPVSAFYLAMISPNLSDVRSFYGPLIMFRRVGMNSGTSLSYGPQQRLQRLHLLPHQDLLSHQETRLALLLVFRLAAQLEAWHSLSLLFCKLITCGTYFHLSFVASFYPLGNNLLIFIFVKGFSLFGWWLFGRRRFIFFADKDLGQVEVSNNSRIFDKKFLLLTIDQPFSLNSGNYQ